MRFPIFVVSALLAVLQSSEAATEQLTGGNIQTATNLWISDQPTATVKYGNITGWDTSNIITAMDELFKTKTNFNDDISKWDVAKVTTTT